MLNNVYYDFIAGQDYDATSTTVTFTPGSSRQCWSIMILDDANDEATECFQVNSVTQSGSINIPAAGSTAMVCIADNDGEYFFLNYHRESLY